MRKIKVLIVDDSPVFRSLLTELISSHPDLEVVAAVEDPYQARSAIKQLKPDVLTLDIEMPKMNGVQFLKNLMRLRPMPVVMISTLTQHGAQATLEALEIGAVDYFPKPAFDNTSDMLNYKQLINEKIIIAATANVAGIKSSEVSASEIKLNGKSQVEVIAIGASTGGTEAIRQLISKLPSGLPPIIITQHISALFTRSFAERLDSVTPIKVEELSEGVVPLVTSHAYVAPGDKHMVVHRQGNRLYAQVDDRPPVNRHKPSVDVMFDSLVQAAPNRSMAVILTGMGRDGANGMLNMKQHGAITLAQDQYSCVVWGMPRVAVEVGAAQYVKPLDQMATQMMVCLNRAN
ncbi:chemotaxis response regulator protein-glutamate methylesterase [Vibrio sp. D420a]|uniref:protein-glutamate methylesterase/protein-glutamine glutaminase n=1 Tax=Vibrio sp. D420a TaxID=2836895 RepID=UPI002552F0DE|nr:chemotaxis response regulator protein-glutamate methylesterase [Vibrio sp. D420a]MDK9761917.1 chemotaxis response regulator protein-glutamate methylesterase [Vibrio sp. D420a]